VPEDYVRQLVRQRAALARASMGTRALGDRYRVFMAKTSNIPFAAIVQGRQQFRFGEIWWRLVVGFVVWAAVLWLHPYFTGGAHPLG